MEKQELVSPSRQCSNTPVGSGQEFLSKGQCDNAAAHPPYSHELAAGKFYPFPPLNSSLNWRRFCGTTDITKNATEELKRLSPNGFLECFSTLLQSRQKCVAAQGDGFEGNVT